MFRTLITAALFGLTACTACDNTHDNEVHRLNFVDLDNVGLLFFADQTTDTLAFESTDDWRLALSGRDTAWLAVTPRAGKVPPRSLLVAKLPLSFSTNTGGATRRARIDITPATSKIGGISVIARQVSWLDIRRPWPILAPGTAPELSVPPTFAEQVTHKAGTTTCSFMIYDRTHDDHALTSSAAWLTVQPEAAHPAAGAHTVTVSFAENPDTAPRTAHLTLTAAGTSTIVTYTQAGRPR